MQTAVKRRASFAALFMAATLGGCGTDDGDIQFYQAIRGWDDAAEDEFSRWVEHLGEARARGACRTLQECLRQPAVNILFSEEDRRMNLFVDCGDLPIIMRAYFAYKTKRPFSWVSEIHGGRYTPGNSPAAFRDHRGTSSLRNMLVSVVNTVHTGFYRMAPGVENTDTYPVDVNRKWVRPGTVYYDPNGHILIVYKVTNDGTVMMLDGHPDNSLTYKRFNESFAKGSTSNGGGFRNWRRYHIGTNGRIVRTGNANSPGFHASAQYQRSYTLSTGGSGSYYDWVRNRLSVAGAKLDPVVEFRERVAALCVDVHDRVEAVQAAIDAGIARKPHPGSLPWNIYGTTGEWETWSTPSRDARLKGSFQGLHKFVSDSVQWVRTRDPRVSYAGTAASLLQDYQSQWNTSARGCQFSYKKSNGTMVRLTLDDVLDRLWKISFDPYHCSELRWGAAGTELQSCPDGAEKLRWYRDEQSLRNNIERVYEQPTPLSFGPGVPPDVDVPALIARLRGAS